MFHALVVPADLTQDAYGTDISDYREIQAVVRGPFDIVRFSTPAFDVSVFVNDEGLILQLPFNERASWLTGRHLAGDALVAGGVDAAGNTLSVDFQLEGTITRLFNQEPA